MWPFRYPAKNSELAVFDPPAPRLGEPATRIRHPAQPILTGMRILQLGFAGQDRLLLTDTFNDLGAKHVAASAQVYPIGLCRPGNLRHDGLMVNLDRFADADHGVDSLLRFRRAVPSCFVVLAASTVARDDFGHHRKAICDSTLRLPLTASRLTEALEAAVQNHRGPAALP